MKAPHGNTKVGDDLVEVQFNIRIDRETKILWDSIHQTPSHIGFSKREMLIILLKHYKETAPDCSPSKRVDEHRPR